MVAARTVETVLGNDTNVPNTAPVITNAIAMTATAAAIMLSANAKGGRLKVEITNEGANTVYVGFTAGVTATGATKGIPVANGATKTLELGDGVDLYGICASTESATLQLVES